jgi:hypothetical protein
MKLSAESGDAFELSVLGYEHADITEGLWDSNWLVVSGKVTVGEHSWRFVHPCVTTFELAELADWLDKLATGVVGPTTCEFAEPNLTFSFSASREPVLRVRFAHESAPPRIKDTAARADGVVMEIPLAEVDAPGAAADIRKALVDYPIRGGAA